MICYRIVIRIGYYCHEIHICLAIVSDHSLNREKRGHVSITGDVNTFLRWTIYYWAWVVSTLPESLTSESGKEGQLIEPRDHLIRFIGKTTHSAQHCCATVFHSSGHSINFVKFHVFSEAAQTLHSLHLCARCAHRNIKWMFHANTQTPEAAVCN